MSDELTGVWTYRSFRNRTAEADSLDQLLAGQGELVIEHPASPGALSGRLVFRGEAPAAKDPRLTLVGGLSGGHARFQGIGVKARKLKGGSTITKHASCRPGQTACSNGRRSSAP